MFTGPPMLEFPDMPTVGQTPASGARRFADRVALVNAEMGVRWTYSQLDHRVGRATALLGELGLREGDRFAYLGKNSDNFVVLFFAAIRAGCILAALNWRSAPAEVTYFVTDTDAGVMFCDPEFLTMVDGACAHIEGCQVIPTEACEGRADVRAMLDADGPVVTEEIAGEERVCLLLYTSGTTGRPKGAMISRNMLTLARKVESSALGFPATGEDTILVAVPAFHLGGITMILISLIRGATCVLTRDPSGANLLRLCIEHEVSLTWLVPTMIRSLVDEARKAAAILPRFRMMMYGGAPVTPELLIEAMETLGCGFSNAYGATEISSVTILPPADHSLDRPGLLKSVGRPMPGHAIDIRDPDGRSLPPHQVGEVWVKSPTLMSGYWNRPAETDEVVVDGWYRTGDGGHLDEDGYLYLADRIKDMIISGGENIYPTEVENVLQAHPAVHDVAVVGVPDAHWGENVAAVFEMREGHGFDADAMRAFAQEQLARYKCPKVMLAVDSLPRTASGKVQRAMVRRMLEEKKNVPAGSA